jgi:hypothetical protein
MKIYLSLAVVVLAGCPDDSGTALWLVPDGSELAVKLTTEKPSHTY